MGAVGKVQTFLTPAQIEALVASYRAGASTTELSKTFGIHRRTVVAGADPGQQRMAVHAWQAKVQDDGIELFDGQAAFGQQAVICPFDHEPGVAGKAA